MKNSRLLLIAILLLAFAAAFLFTANAQRLAQPVAFEAEMGAPVYQTLAQSGGVRWIAYGYLYPVGTFDGLPPCEQPEGVTPTGNYRISGEWGDAATYRVTFGAANDGKQFVTSGIFSYGENELGQPETVTYGAARLVRGQFEEGYEMAITQRAAGCLGARVMVKVVESIGLKPE